MSEKQQLLDWLTKALNFHIASPKSCLDGYTIEDKDSESVMVRIFGSSENGRSYGYSVIYAIGMLYLRDPEFSITQEIHRKVEQLQGVIDTENEKAIDEFIREVAPPDKG